MSNRNIDRAPFGGAKQESLAQPEYMQKKGKWYKAMPSPHNPNEISWLDVDSRLSEAERTYLEYTYSSVQPEAPADVSTSNLWDAIQPQPAVVETYQPEVVNTSDAIAERKRALAALQGLATPLQREIEELERAEEEKARAEAERLNEEALFAHMQRIRGITLQPATTSLTSEMSPTLPQALPEVSARNLSVADTVEAQDQRPSKEKDTSKNKASKTKMTRRRQLGIVGVAVAGATVLTGAGLALTGNTFGLGGTNASIAPDKKVAVDPDTIPDLSSASIVNAFGGCLDERGAGPALYSGMFDATATSTYEFTNLAGGKYPVAAKLENGQYLKPTTTLIDTPVRYTACVEAANRASVVTEIKDDTVIIDLAKISPQIYVDLNKAPRSIPQYTKGFNGTVDLFVAAGAAGDKNGISAEEGARLKAVYADEPNKNSEITQVRIRAAEVLSDEAGAPAQQANATTKKEIVAKINEDIAKQYEQGLSKYQSVKVNFTGELDDPQAKDPMLIKNPAAQPSNAFKIDHDSLDITKFAVKVDGSTEEKK